jgi:2-succinyl-5-enolpyruvyl-6-hydroxy-3-cyclohexene-1-carboxylate synthase
MNTDVDVRSTNSLWASVLVETLVRAGVRYAVISPGSRSAPLAIAFARHSGVEAIPVLDERSAGFFALGIAKWDLSPVVLVCTSGTAGANYFPAVIEAYESGVPLVVITADRPPELRSCASGQTIDQQKLYGDYVNFFHELAVPELDEARLAYLRQTAVHAISRTSQPQAGPVHLNASFRDPLPPMPDGGVAEAFAKTIEWDRFFAEVAPTARLISLAPPLEISSDVHGAIIVGPSQPADTEAFITAIGDLARKLGWPVLVDGLTPARNFATRVPHLVTMYDTILRNSDLGNRLKPERVICIGSWPTSKVLREWLGSADAKTWLVTDRADNRDALHGRTQQLAVTLRAFVASVPQAAEPNGYQQMWSGYEKRARAALDERMRQDSALVEPKAAWLLAQHLPRGTPLFVANSMPIRDVEYVWPPNDREIVPRCNRGANGIDGTLSSALGVAHASGRPTVLLTGDLALLHDANGFLLRANVRTSLTIVLINNHGGGIFEHLPVARFDPPFEKFFATPQEIDFDALAAAHGAAHISVTDWAQFIDLLSTLPTNGIRVLELNTDRKLDAGLRRQWFNEIARSLA